MILLFKKGFPDSSVGKESTCNVGDPSLIPGSGRSTGEGIGYPLHYSRVSLVAQLVTNPLQCGRPGFDPWVGKIPWRRKRLPTPVSWPREFHGLYSLWSCNEWLWASLVAQTVKNLPIIWEIRVQSLGWEDLLEKGMATPPVFLPGECHGQKSLVGYSPRVRKDSDMTERLTHCLRKQVT